MELVESLSLGSRRQLLLVVCGNQRYLVGAGADSVGSILAIEAGSGVGAGAQPGTRSQTGGRTANGPELVRRRIRGIASETETGSDV